MKYLHIGRLQFFGIACAVVVLASASATMAQRQKMSVDDRVKHLTEQLTLSKAQADSVRVIYEAVDKKRSAMYKEHSDDRSAMREEMKKVMDGVDASIEAFLTKEQKGKYDVIKKERHVPGEAPQHHQESDTTKSGSPKE